MNSGLVLPMVLLMLTVISNITIQLMTDAIGYNKGMASFMSYSDRMHEAEKKLIAQEQSLKNKFQEIASQEMDSNKNSPTEDINKLLPPETQIIGFVPDHLEFGCQEGVYIVQVESGSLRTHWALRGH